MPTKSIHTKGLILVWAFAESGIGGILHSLKLPFTGIFVGGIAVICVALLGFYSKENKNTILKALAIVLMVKLTVSPQSPWQAYVAVIFQGYLGHFLFRNISSFSLRTLVFSILCLLESAVQKILLSLLIYGITFFKAVDTSAQSIGKSIGYTGDGSFVFMIFGLYIVLHLVVGLMIGLWIPSIPAQVDELSQQMTELNINSGDDKFNVRRQSKSVVFGFIIFAAVLLCIHFLVPSMKLGDLIFIFVRAVTVSLVLIFVLGPILLWVLKSFSKGMKMDKNLLNEILEEIPLFTSKAFQVLNWVNRKYKGVAKIKNMVLGLLVISQTQKMTSE